MKTETFNERAIRFYEPSGFVKFGAAKEEVDERRVGVVVLSGRRASDLITRWGSRLDGDGTAPIEYHRLSKETAPEFIQPTSHPWTVWRFGRRA